MTDWSPEQKANANAIISIGQKMGMGSTEIAAALVAAMQESSLRNINYGDRDSVGLFQQRPSQGWGTVEQILNPVYAITQFYDALKGVDGRKEMTAAEMAQAVQRSAYPDAYDKWLPEATAMVGAPGAGTKIVPSSAASEIAALNEPTTAPSAMGALAATTENTTGLAAPTAGAAPQAPPGASGIQPFNSPSDYEALLSEQGYSTASAHGARASLVNYAKQFLGTPYVWGGTSLQNGVDCSGFVQAVFQHFGVNLPRVSYQQATAGKRVDLNQLRPGDLVAWDNSSRNNGADHIAIYVGGGKIIEAPRPGRSVQISDLYDTGIAWGVRMKHF